MTWNVIRIEKPTFALDELGNQVQTGAESVLTSRCRFSPWTVEEVSAYGTEYTASNRRYAIPYPYLSRTGICKDYRDTPYTATIDGTSYHVIQVSEYFPRWLVLTVKAVRA